MRRRLGFTLICGLVAISAAACGGDHEDHGGSSEAAGVGEPADAMGADRTVEVEAVDTLRFEPDEIEVAVGETITFSVSNAGDLEHEFVIGSEEEAEEAHSGDMEHGEGSLLLDGGASGEVTWNFTEAGELAYACYIDGHNQAGMKGTILITE